FARTAGGAREQQIGDVRAGNQENESNRAKQRPEEQADLGAQNPLVEWIGVRVEGFVGDWIPLSQFRAYSFQLGSCLPDRDPVGQSANRQKTPRFPGLLGGGGREGSSRHP